jgi:hypothetical protein
MYVDPALRESTRALTTTFPNSVIDAFGIFSVSSRSRPAGGFHSTDAAFTWYATIAPPPRDTCRTSAPDPNMKGRKRCGFYGVHPGAGDE